MKPEKKISPKLLAQIEQIGEAREKDDDILLKYFTEEQVDCILFSTTMWTLSTIQDIILFNVDYDEDSHTAEYNSKTWDSVVEYIESKDDELMAISNFVFNNFLDNLNLMSIEVIKTMKEDEYGNNPLEHFLYFKLENIKGLFNIVDLAVELSFNDYILPEEEKKKRRKK